MTWVKWKLVLERLGILLISAQDRCQFAPNVPPPWKPFWAHPLVDLGDVGQVEAHFGPFGGSVNQGARKLHSLC
jgi:hypothetical protein